MRKKLLDLTPGVLLPVLLSLMPVLASAQASLAPPHVLRSPAVNEPILFDVSPPLSEMAGAPSSPTDLLPPNPVVAEEPGGQAVRYPKLQLLTAAAQQGLRTLPDAALQTLVGPYVSATPGPNLLGVGYGFPGYSITDNVPSDTNLAVGDTQVVQWVNVFYVVFDKDSGAVLAGPIAGNRLWRGFGGPCETVNSGDIVAQWDKIAHRWLLAQNAFYGPPYTTCVAISQTADATGAYYRYSFPQAGFPDYPKWGVWPDAYYQSQNNFGAGGRDYVGATACAYERAKMLAGDHTAKQICFTTGTFDDSLLPGDLDSANSLPPPGQPEVYLGTIDNTPPTGNRIHQYLFHVDFATPSNSTFTGAGGGMPIAVASFNLACGGTRACIPQEGVADQLRPVGDRLMYRLAYRNLVGDHQTWLVSHAVTAGGKVGERWYEFRAPEDSTKLLLYQQGTFAPDNNYRWMGSLAMDGAGNIALGYSVSSASMFPSISYTGRLPGDPPGTMETESPILKGAGSQTGNFGRWGDYTSMALDEADDCTFWYTNQYYMNTASSGWSTRLASFKFPNCPPPAFVVAATPASRAVSRGSNTTYTTTVTGLNGFDGTVTFSAKGLPNGASANFSPGSVTGPGSSTLAVSTNSTTSPGTYTVAVTGTSGALTGKTSVTLVVNPLHDFSLSANPSTRNIAVGSNSTYTATVTALNGFSGAVTFSATGLPNGASTSFSPTSVTGAGSSTLTINTSSTTPLGTYSLTITGRSGTLVHTTSVTLVIDGPPDFSLSATPSTRTVFRGSNATYTTTLAALNGFTGTVTFSATGLPNGASASFSPTSVTGAGSTTLTISTGSSTPLGTYTVTITGTSGVLTHSASATLAVTPPRDFSLSAAPSTRTVIQGSNATYTSTVAALNGFTGTVTFSATGLPNGASASFSPTSVTGAGSATLTISTSRTAAVNAYTVTVTGTSGALTHSTSVTLVINPPPDFSLAVMPSSQAVIQGSSATYTATVTALNGFTGTVTFSATGLPNGASASFSPTSVIGAGFSTLTIITNSMTPLGTYTVTATASSALLTHSTSVTVVVNPLPDFSLTLTPQSQSVAQGSIASYTVTLAPLNGFNDSVGLWVDCPSSSIINCAWDVNPVTVTSPKSSTAILTITTSNKTPTGSYTLVVKATAGTGGVAHTTMVTLVVTATSGLLDVPQHLTAHLATSTYLVDSANHHMLGDA